MREKDKVLIKPITGCIPGRLKGVCVCLYIFKVLIKLPVTPVSIKIKNSGYTGFSKMP